MGAPNRASSDSWDRKDDLLWAVFINVLELAILEILGDVELGVGYFFKSSMCATILTTDTGVFFTYITRPLVYTERIYLTLFNFVASNRMFFS